MLWLLLSSSHSSRAFPPTSPPPPKEASSARGWKGTQLGQLTQTEQRYSLAQDITLSNKILRGGSMGKFLFKAHVFQSSPYTYWSSASQEVTGHLPGDGKWGIKTLFLLWFSVQPSLFPFDCFYLNPSLCPSFIFLTHRGSGTREQLGLAAS